MKVLIVSPRFPPSNAADCHRVRLLLPYLADLGCNAEVLTVDARDVSAPVDSWLEARVHNVVPVHRVRAWTLRGWGLDGLAQRTGKALYGEGCRLLRSGDFDLVFFSTTEFLLHFLGPLWQRKFNVPFCMDYQDPWRNDYYRAHPDVIPPGGRLKYGISDRLHSIGERCVAPRCSGFLAVSKDYLDTLTIRYGKSVTWQPRLIQPFPGEPAEIDDLRQDRSFQSSREDRGRLLRYIGRGGPDMVNSARVFFKAWRNLIDTGAIDARALRFEAIGTSYHADKSPEPTFTPLASDFGLQDLVSEDPRRLGYRDMLLSLLDSDGLVVFGSDDPAYTASKIYPYLLAQKPLLALFHQRSSVVSVLEAVGGGICATFDDNGFAQNSETEIRNFLRGFVNGDNSVSLNMIRFEEYTAKAQASRLVQWFSDCLDACRAHPRLVDGGRS